MNVWPLNELTIPWGWVATVLYLILFAIPLVMLFIVPVNRKPSSAIAWLLLIAILPVVGLFIFLLIGSPKLPSWRRALQQTMDERIEAKLEELAEHPELGPALQPEIAPRYQPFIDLNACLGRMPAFGGNQITVLPRYQETIEHIIADIDMARETVHVEYYILTLDETTEPFFQALERAVARGVTIRVLFDALAIIAYPRHRAMRRRLTEMGAIWHAMLPIRFNTSWTRPDLRNHRKILVIDGRVGYTGSQNIIDRSYHSRSNRRKGIFYIELVIRVEGPVVGELQAVFSTDWYSETQEFLGDRRSPERVGRNELAGDVLAQVLPSGPGQETENNLRLFNMLIYAARTKIVLVNPYFVPDESIMVAITTAAQRGVDVTLITSEIGDQFFVYHAQRSFYDELLAAGVKVKLYRKPAILHSKFITVDDDIALIGSSNLDMRSFLLNLEVSMVCYNRGVVRDLREIEATYLANSRELTLGEWRQRPLINRMISNTARLTSAFQ